MTPPAYSENDAEDEGDGEDLRPKAGDFVVALIAAAQCARLEVKQQQRQPHGQLRK
jgi:hypothetical protein